ncbi:MAG: hypothetical protein H0W06_09405 [Chloroflexia bacterium]|nr:hypothetical protein [Chloroflexia bacterium]
MSARRDAFNQGDIVSSLRRQARSFRPVMMLIYTPLVVVFAIVVVVRIGTGVAMADLTRDALQVAGAPVYTGVLATLGGLLWAATAAICLFGYAVIRGQPRRDGGARFLLAGGLVTTLLMLDDVFMFHEIVFPRYLGISENVVYTLIAAVLVWFVVAFHTAIPRTDFLFLVLAFGAFAFSLGIDRTESINPFPATYLLEDGAKLFGLINWAAYFWLASIRAVGPRSPDSG